MDVRKQQHNALAHIVQQPAAHQQVYLHQVCPGRFQHSKFSISYRSFQSTFQKSLKVLVHYQIQTLNITLHETYHPLSTLFPKNVSPEATHRLCSMPVPTGHITFTAAPFQEAHTNRRASCIHQTTHSIAHQARSMIYKQVKFHSQLLSNAMFVTLPLPTYMLKFSRCPRSPHNYKLGMHTLLLHDHATGHDTHTHMWHAKLFSYWQPAPRHGSRARAHTHTHARPRIYTHLHAPHAQLPHDCPAKPPTQGAHPPTPSTHGHCKAALPYAWATGTHAFSQHLAHTSTQFAMFSTFCSTLHQCLNPDIGYLCMYEHSKPTRHRSQALPAHAAAGHHATAPTTSHCTCMGARTPFGNTAATHK